ncbi:MAG: glycosyltransferase, group I [Parcubacteria group bacterium Gr01-1014_106]|nr:MAG: glycosyltransferase, group I [Parcubacteria group bacterium Gr01-1014_106]
MVVPPLDPCQPPDLRHLRRLTDARSILQHTLKERPLPEFGYAIDDGARALLVVTETERVFPSADARERAALRQLATLYLNFIADCQLPDGRFHNFVAHDRTFLDAVGSQDAYGRTVWALGITAVRNADADCRGRAAALLRTALPHVGDLSFLRSQAFALLGLCAVLTPEDPFAVSPSVEHVLSTLLHAFDDTATDAWPWFEESLRYSNAALPYAVLAAARHPEVARRFPARAERARTVGLASLDFLLRELMTDGIPTPVGNHGWYTRGGERPLYDQQGVDAAAMVVACVEAFRLTSDVRYRTATELWWGWFFGNNTQSRSLYRPEDGAVLDGVHAEGVSENRGGESILAFLIAHLAQAEAFCTRGKS